MGLTKIRKGDILYKPLKIETLEVHGADSSLKAMRLPMEGRKEKTETMALARALVKRGTEHAKFSRGIIVWAEMWFQVGWMVEFETYRHGKETLSTSSAMHVDLRDLSGEELAEEKQRGLGEKYYHRIGTFSYQCLRKMYIERRKHKHPDWQIFCDWIETLPFFQEFIMPELGSTDE